MNGFATVSDGIGAMNERVEIIQLTKPVESDFGGEQLTGSSTLSTVWANVEYLETGSNEVVKSGQHDLVQNIRVKMWYLSTVKTNMLLKLGGLYYDILSVLPDHKKAFMTIEAKQRGESWNQTVT